MDEKKMIHAAKPVYTGPGGAQVIDALWAQPRGQAGMAEQRARLCHSHAFGCQALAWLGVWCIEDLVETRIQKETSVDRLRGIWIVGPGQRAIWLLVCNSQGKPVGTGRGHECERITLCAGSGHLLQVGACAVVAATLVDNEVGDGCAVLG